MKNRDVSTGDLGGMLVYVCLRADKCEHVFMLETPR